MQIVPTKEQINSWIRNFVPEQDLFFLEENDLGIFEEYLSEVLVVPVEEFFNHSFYKQIQFINSYMYWTISSKVKYVLVAQPGWISNLPRQKKKDLLDRQINLGTGLIFPLSIFSSTEHMPKEYIVYGNEDMNENIKKYIGDKKEEFVVIRNDVWNNLPYTMKVNAITAYAQIWDDWTVHDFPPQTPNHIVKYGNKFTTLAGSNCLAATLFAITGKDWIINEWVHPETFLNGLHRANYCVTNDNIRKGDVVTWVDKDHVVKHASYHINNNLFFNKNGQTYFEPWKIIGFEQLNELWSGYKINVYRKSY